MLAYWKSEGFCPAISLVIFIADKNGAEMLWHFC